MAVLSCEDCQQSRKLTCSLIEVFPLQVNDCGMLCYLDLAIM
jgi:hypothetical protein